ncbi:MAG TPA: Do family serine endopeptidase [Candidatus Kryptonia bacterium]
MRSRTLIGAALLVAVGVVFGALLVTSFNGVGPSFGFSGEKVRLGGPAPLGKTDMNLMATQEAFVKIAKAVTPTVVSVTVISTPKSKMPDIPFFHDFQFKMPDQQPEKGMGSGVIVTQDGYIITNNHVVDGADKNGIKVKLYDKREFDGKLIGTDPTTDVAVIKISASDLPVAALGNSDSVEVGQWVLAIGNPLGLNSTVTAGIISAQGRDIDVSLDRWGIRNFIQTDAAINPGNSGGALVNIRGEVIGINSAIATRTGYFQGYGFAIPMNLVRKTAEDLISFGRVKRPMLGVQLKSGIDETDAHALGLPKPEGVWVQDVIGGSPAEAAGVKAGDVILSVDGKDVNAANELQVLIAEHKPGDVVVLKIFRDGKSITKEVTLTELSQTDLASSAQSNEKEDKEPSETGQVNVPKLGITIQPLDKNTKKDAKVDGGVLVSEVAPNGPAADRTLLPNDIITEVDHHAVGSVKELTDILKSKNSGDYVMLRVLTKQGSSYSSRFIAVEIGG